MPRGTNYFGSPSTTSFLQRKQNTCHSRRQALGKGGHRIFARGSRASAQRVKLQDFRQIWTYQIASLVHATCIAPGAIAIKLFLPFHHVCLAAVFLDEPADAVAALASAFSAFDAEHVEFSCDVTEDEIGSPRHDGDITT